MIITGAEYVDNYEAYKNAWLIPVWWGFSNVPNYNKEKMIVKKHRIRKDNGLIFVHITTEVFVTDYLILTSALNQRLFEVIFPMPKNFVGETEGYDIKG